MSGAGQNRTEPKPFAWTKKSTRAAMLCAEDLLTDSQIADEIGIARSTLALWKEHPEFTAKISKHVAVLQERARAEGLGRLDKRKAAYEDRHARMSRLIEERAEDMAGEIAGGDTGLLVRQYKSIGTGPNARMVTEYAVDTGLLRELRELEKQVAQDTGQWSEKREISGPDGGPLPIMTVEVVAPGEGDA